MNMSVCSQCGNEAKEICPNCGEYLCADCRKEKPCGYLEPEMAYESLAETRARFRKEFPNVAVRIDGIGICAQHSDRRLWQAFAVGAGHPHDAKFRDEVRK